MERAAASIRGLMINTLGMNVPGGNQSPVINFLKISILNGKIYII